MSSAPIEIVSADAKDASEVAKFCQPIYAAVYPNDKYGMKPEHFSPEVFRTEDTLSYFADTLEKRANQRAYLAMSAGKLVGCISIERQPDHYSVRAFYVEPGLQGQGIGRRLTKKALKFVTEDLPVRAEVAETNTSARSIYKQWGLKDAPELGISLRYWPEWPDGLKNGYIFMQANKGEIIV